MKTPCAILLSFSLAGCAALSQLQGGTDVLNPFLPKVSFERFSVRKLSFSQADVDFTFAVKNPNPLQVKLSSFHYAFSLEGNQVLSGDDPDGLVLRAQGSSEVTLPVSLVYEEIRQTLQDTKGKDELNFTLSGALGFQTPAGEIKIPFQEQGKFPALRLPKVSLQSLKVGKPDLFRQTVTAELRFLVQNDQASRITFESFDYRVSLQGKEAAQGKVEALDAIEGASERVLRLPIEINLLSLGTSIARLLGQGGQVNLALAARLNVNTPFGKIPLSLDQSGKVNIE